MNKAYLLTGGNKGNRKASLEKAAELIAMRCGRILLYSSLYETAAWGKTDQPAFLNQALILETNLSPTVLMQQLLEIESRLGRIRNEKYGPRVIDIDMLLYDDLVMQTDLLTLPHPELTRRRFALEPLAEIAPALTHPVVHKTIHELLSACEDILPVRKLH